jgi:3-hexulose-6-phosphate synthase/6-phospho-3-hexuloisomerase
MPRPTIQVALDTTCLSEALLLAKGSVDGGADWIEAGTPLIKSQGMEAVRRLVEVCGERAVVADMKTMDAGRLEAEMAISAGAKVVSVCGLADDLTIIEAVRVAQSGGAAIMVDLINTRDTMARALEIQSLGANYIYLHTGLDVQSKEGSITERYDVIERLSSTLRIPLAVGGGITAANAKRAKDAGASIIIVGSFITKARDPVSALRSILHEVS